MLILQEVVLSAVVLVGHPGRMLVSSEVLRVVVRAATPRTLQLCHDTTLLRQTTPARDGTQCSSNHPPKKKRSDAAGRRTCTTPTTLVCNSTEDSLPPLQPLLLLNPIPCAVMKQKLLLVVLSRTSPQYHPTTTTCTTANQHSNLPRRRRTTTSTRIPHPPRHSAPTSGPGTRPNGKSTSVVPRTTATRLGRTIKNSRNIPAKQRAKVPFRSGA